MAIKNFGIDLSYANNIYDYDKLLASNYSGYKIKYAFLRLGYYGKTDTRFMEHYRALSGKIPLGVYVYSYARTVDAAREEAAWALKALHGLKLEFPVAFDYEDISLLSPRLSRKEYSEICAAFLDEIEEANYYAMLYSNVSFLEYYADRDALKKYPLWLAHYVKEENKREFDQKIWQFGTFRPSGAYGEIDGNFAYEQIGKYIRDHLLNIPAEYRVTAEKTVSAWERAEHLRHLEELGYTASSQKI